jgi:hypothetical protein
VVAAIYNLEIAEGLRPGPFITAQTARRICLRAVRKLRRALIAQGVDAQVVDDYFHINDAMTARNHANLALLLPPPARVRDEGDPHRRGSLHALVG